MNELLPQHPVFQAAQEKLKRAFEDLQTLSTYVAVFEKTRQYRCAVNFETHTGWWVIKIRVLQEPGPEYGVLLGVIAYQCLSALNILVWELAARKVGRRKIFDIRRQIEIPVAKSPEGFQSKSLVHHAYVSKPALAILESLQPYKEGHGPSGPHEHPLPLIKEIADSDKHRVLTPAFVQMEMKGVAWVWDDPAADPIHEQLLPFGRPIMDGTPIARIRFRKENRKANVRVDPEPELAMRFSTDNWGIEVETVRMFALWTTQAVLKFAPLFSTQ